MPKTAGRVIGGDGVCILNDGSRVYGMGVSGMLAEKATIEKDRIVILPSKINDVTAAALPNAVIGSAMGLRFKADLKAGEVVLVTEPLVLQGGWLFKSPNIMARKKLLLREEIQSHCRI